MTFVMEYNITISAANHARKLFHAMFPDSNIAKGFPCAKMKSAAIFKHQAEIRSNLSDSADPSLCSVLMGAIATAISFIQLY